MKGINAKWLVDELLRDGPMKTEIRRLDQAGYVVIMGSYFNYESGYEVVIVRGHPVDDLSATTTLNSLELHAFIGKETVLDFYRTVINQLKLL